MERFLPYACNKCEKDIPQNEALTCKECGLVFCSYTCFAASWEAGEQHSSVHGALAELRRVHLVLNTSTNEALALARIKRFLVELPDVFPKEKEYRYIPENAAMRMLRKIINKYKSDAVDAVLRELGIYVGLDFEIAFAKKFLETLLLDIFTTDARRTRHLFLRLAGKGYVRTLAELDRLWYRRARKISKQRRKRGES